MGVQFFVPLDALTLAVTEQSTLAGLDVSGALHATSSVTLSNGLSVTGNASVSTLVVSGMATLGDGASITSGDLTVTLGATILSGGLSVAEGAAVDQLSVSGTTTLTGVLTVAAASELGVLHTSEMATLDGGLTVSGPITLDTLTIGDSNASFATQVVIADGFDLTIGSGELVVGGGIVLGGDLNLTSGDLTLTGGDLSVTGTGTLSVTGLTSLETVQVSGPMVVTGDGVEISTGHLTVGGLLTANGGLTVVGDVALDFVTVHNNSSVGGDLSVSGISSLSGGATTITAPQGDNSTNVATTAFITRAIIAEQTRATNAEASLASSLYTEQMRATSAEAYLAPLYGPSFTGTPTAPTASGTTSTTQIATTEFVHNMITTLTTVSPNTITLLDTLSAALATDTGPGGVQNAVLKVVTDEVTRAGLAESGLSTSISYLAPSASPSFTGDVTVSSGNVVLSSTDANKGRVVFAARDGGGDYFMGVDASSPSDKLIIKKGTATLMEISDTGFSGGTPSAQTVTFVAPVVMEDVLDLKDCMIKLSSLSGISGANLLELILSLGKGSLLTTL